MVEGMAKSTHIGVAGDSLVVVMSDGRRYPAYPIPGNIFRFQRQFDVIDVDPDPGLPGNPDPEVPGDPTGWMWPFQYSRYVLSTSLAQYGMRVNPVTGVYKLHAGLDFGGAGIKGLPIPCASAGTVKINARDARGNNVTVTHGGGFTTNYFHMQDGSIAIQDGQQVDKGTILGRVGTTGSSTGEHLHWETRINGEPINPRDFMKARGVPES